MRQQILKIFRSAKFQPFWVKLHHISLIGMNYFGGASLNHSGEISALSLMKKKLEEKEQIVIFDVGANSGEYSLLSYKFFGQNSVIHAFEPSVHAFKQLENKTSDLSEIKIHKLGIGMEKEKLQLFSSGKGRTTASVYNLAYSINDFRAEFTESIDVTSIDSFCQENNISFIDILKIDIEGHELAALKGARNMIESNSVNFIQFEFGKCDIDSKVFFRDFYDILVSKYKIYRIVSDGLYEISNYDSSLEVFHTANFLAEKIKIK